MKNCKYEMYNSELDSDFDWDSATDRERAQEIWGNPDVDPNTGTDYDEERGQYDPETSSYEYDNE